MPAAMARYTTSMRLGRLMMPPMLRWALARVPMRKEEKERLEREEFEAKGFVEVRRSEILAMLDGERIPDEEVRSRLATAKVDASHPGTPSVEAPLHAVCLGLPGVSFIGHTHPTAINGITVAARGQVIIDAYGGIDRMAEQADILLRRVRMYGRTQMKWADVRGSGGGRAS